MCCFDDNVLHDLVHIHGNGVFDTSQRSFDRDRSFYLVACHWVLDSFDVCKLSLSFIKFYLRLGRLPSESTTKNRIDMCG